MADAIRWEDVFETVREPQPAEPGVYRVELAPIGLMRGRGAGGSPGLVPPGARLAVAVAEGIPRVIEYIAPGTTFPEISQADFERRALELVAARLARK